MIGKRVYFGIAAALLGSMALLGAGQASAAGAEGKRVAVLSAPMSSAYIGAWNKAFDVAAEPLGLKVTHYTTPYDAALQAQQIDDAIAQKFDMLLIDSIDEKALVPALNRAKAAKVPVMIGMNQISQEYSNLFLAYVGYDDVLQGRLAGEALVKALAAIGKTKAQVAVITGPKTQPSTLRRMTGFNEAFKDHPGIKIVAHEEDRFNVAHSEQVAGQLLVRYSGQGGIDAFIGTSDVQSAGIIQAVEGGGLPLGVKEKGVLVVSTNCNKDGMSAIKAGKQLGTNSLIPAMEAQEAAKQMVAYFNGQTLQNYIFIPTVAISAENVDAYATPDRCSY